MAATVKIPKSKAGLKYPLDRRHALLLIERENAWITSGNRELAESFCTMFTIVVNDRSAGQFVVSSGRRRLL